MAVKLRLQRKGRTKAPFYHIVVADSRSPRDGKFIEKIGTYNPLTVPATIEIDREKAYDWLTKGAQPTDTVRAILGFKGVLYRKHLQLGVKKGALTQEQADAKASEFIEKKEGAIAARKAETAKKAAALVIAVDGKPKAKPTPPPAEEPAPEVVAEETETAAAPEAPAAEETNAEA